MGRCQTPTDHPGTLAHSDIQNTGSSYTLVAADEGKTIKVRMSFTDDAGTGKRCQRGEA